MNASEKILIIFAFLIVFITGCNSNSISKVVFDCQPYESIINAKTLTIEVISINNALSSESVIEDSINYYRPYVAGKIKVLDFNYINLDLGKDNTVSKLQFEEIIDSRKFFGPTWITIVICPNIDFFSGRGFYKSTAPQNKPELVRHSIAINANTCNKNASAIPFASSEHFTSLVILHELCHALRVPARKNHMKEGNEGHCSNPNCILYPMIDFNSALSAIFHLGPPKGLCKMCREEVFAVQNAKKEKI